MIVRQAIVPYCECTERMSVKVKICGITTVADGLAAAEAGADLVGLMLYEKSPRYITVEAARDIARQLPPFVLKVGVFVNPSENQVLRSIGECGLNLLQFHGDEPPEFCVQFGVMSVKAFRVRDANSLEALPGYTTDAWLLDAYSPDQPGGTGVTFNWDLAIDAKRFGKPIFLAGGLTPENVGEGVRKVRPFGVDVSSGVEASPGRKDPVKVRAFVQAVRDAS